MLAVACLRAVEEEFDNFSEEVGFSEKADANIVDLVSKNSEYISKSDGAEGFYWFHWTPGMDLASGQRQKKIYELQDQ